VERLLRPESWTTQRMVVHLTAAEHTRRVEV